MTSLNKLCLYFVLTNIESNISVMHYNYTKIVSQAYHCSQLLLLPLNILTIKVISAMKKVMNNFALKIVHYIEYLHHHVKTESN